MGLSTILGLSRRGYFIPYRYAVGLTGDDETPAYPELIDLFESRRPAFAQMLSQVQVFAAALEKIGPDSPPQPRWNQGWFPRLDAAMAYVMIATHRPRKVVEVGSGHSTRFMVRAARDTAAETEFTAIDPAPRADLAGLGVAQIAATLQTAGKSPFDQLAAGDILFVDSSHILMPGSDADVLINRVWPRLSPGVIVHFHDIFLPDGYPASWAWRGYNEQLGVAPLLTGGGAEILFSSHFVATRMTGAMEGNVISRIPLLVGAVETSLWLKKRDAAACAS